MSVLKDKVVVITGGGGLLGRNFSRAVAAQGGVAVIADLNMEAALAVEQSINKDFSGHALAAELDITDKDSIDRLIQLLEQRYGKIDAVVNNAYPRNKNFGRKFEDIEYQDLCENLNLHLAGYLLVSQRFARHFESHGNGNIINMASVYGCIAPRFDIYKGTSMTNPLEYAAIKSGIIHSTHYLAQYLKGKGIRVNCLSPGGILDRQPEPFLRAYREYCNDKGMLDPEDVCGTLVFLLSDASKYMTGQNLIVDDGFTL